MIRRVGLVLLLLLASSAFGQILPPIELAGGLAVSAPVARPTNVYLQLLASNGDGFFSVWPDERYGQPDTVGTFFDAAGAPVGAGPRPVLANWMEDWPAFVVPVGDDYALFVTFPGGSFAGRVQADGTVESVRHLDQTSWPTAGVWTGSRYAVVGQGPIQFLDRDFNPLGSSAAVFPYDTVLAAANGRILVLTETATGVPLALTRTLHAQILNESGEPLSAPRVLATRLDTTKYGGLMGAAASWNGSHFVVVWTNPDSVAGAAVSLDGEIGRRFTVATKPWFTTAEIAWDGRTHLVVWQDGEPHSISAAVVSSGGDLVETFSIPTGEGQDTRPAVAANRERFLVISNDRLLSIQPLETDRVVNLGPFVEQHLPQSQVVIAAGTTQLAVAWVEAKRAVRFVSAVTSRVFVSLIAPNGSKLVDGIQIGESEDGTSSLGIASAGDAHLVTWTDQGVRRGTLVRTDGSHQEVVLPTSGAVSNGRSFALVWIETLPSSDERALMFAAVSPQGEIGSLRTLAVPADWVPSTTWTGQNYAIHWGTTAEHHLMTVSPDGIVQSDVVIPKLDVMASSADEQGLVVVQWTRQPDGTALIETSRFGFDGSRAARGESVVLPLVNGSSPPIAALIRTPTGFTLAVSYEVDGQSSIWDTRFFRLDSEGRIAAEFARTRDLKIMNGVHAFGTTWFTQMSRWKPVPHVHESFIWRAFYRPLTPKIRAVRR
ncbi:MAG: hypothetical protein WA208_02815 [Thermoanaerobaculia bacterium]